MVAAEPGPSREQAEQRTERMAEAALAADKGDYETALGIWVLYAHGGDARAQAEIGRCFANGWGVERNPDLALRWLMPAARSGEPFAQRVLGDFYFNGEDGTPQCAMAEEWYARAANQGEPSAQDMLSLILTEADHRKPDYSQARAWAALLGGGDGQAMLGAAHHIGAGVACDRVLALAWLTRARLTRSKVADRFYHAVRESCTPDERREAERRSSLLLGGGKTAS